MAKVCLAVVKSANDQEIVENRECVDKVHGKHTGTQTALAYLDHACTSHPSTRALLLPKRSRRTKSAL